MADRHTKRTARAVEALTSASHRTAVTAVRNGTITEVPHAPAVANALASLAHGDPRAAVPALTVRLLAVAGVDATDNPSTVVGPRVTVRIGRDVIDVLLDPHDLAAATVMWQGHGTHIDLHVPGEVNDPLSLATRLATRLADLIGLWDESGLIAA